VGQNLATSLDLLISLVDATYQSKNSGTLTAALCQATPSSTVIYRSFGRKPACFAISARATGPSFSLSW
jgi:hypothetical protein